MAIAPIPMPRTARPGGYANPNTGGGPLGNLLGWNGNPFYDAFDSRRNMLMGLGADLLSGNWGQGRAMQGAQIDDAYATQQKAEAERQQQINQTTEWLRENYPQFADLPPDQGFQLAMKVMSEKQKGAEGAPANIREWEYYNALPDDATKAEYLRMKRANPYLDIGTGFVQPDPVNPGSTAGPEIVKDNFTPAYDTAAGTAEAKTDAETRAAFESLGSKLPGLQAVVSELSELAKVATYTQTGQLIDTAMREAGLEPGEAAIARTKYIAMVDNQVLPLLRDTFGAAFTVKEGETLRATLGDPNKSPPEKQAILEAFIEQKVRDLEALQSRLPQPKALPSGTTSTGVPWSLE